MLGALLLVAAGILTFRSVASSSGARSPQAAAERFLDAIDNGDAVGVLQYLTPEEARLFVPNGQAVVRQLRRFGTFSATSNDVKPGTLPKSALPKSALPNPGRWRTVETKLSGSRTKANVEVVPPNGSGVRLGLSSQALTESALGRSLQRALSPTKDRGNGSILISVLRTRSRWYVSLAGTLGNSWERVAARKQDRESNTTASTTSNDQSNEPQANEPSTNESNLSAGAENPTDAVQAWLDALVQLDQATLRSLTNPVEAKAFPLSAINTIWGERIEKLQRQFELSIPAVAEVARQKSNRFGQQTIVPITIRDAKFALTEPGAEPFIAQYHEGCFVILSGSKATKRCEREIPRFAEQFSVPVTKATIDRFVGRLSSLEAARKSLPGIVTVQVSGRWYVSQTQTALLNIVQGLANAKRADIEALVDDVSNAISSQP